MLLRVHWCVQKPSACLQGRVTELQNNAAIDKLRKTAEGHQGKVSKAALQR